MQLNLHCFERHYEHMICNNIFSRSIYCYLPRGGENYTVTDLPCAIYKIYETTGSPVDKR